MTQNNLAAKIIVKATQPIKKEICNSFESETKCKNPDCSWFNHSQVGLAGGDYPPGYNGSLDN